jgi:hypothetical protein
LAARRGAKPPAPAREVQTRPPIDAHALRSLIENLVASNLDGVRLAKRVMLLQEMADAAEGLATATIDAAVSSVGDDEAVERAVAASTAATEAHEAELQASIEWRLHLERTHDLADIAEEVLRQL